MRDTEFKIAALAFPQISFKIPKYYIEGVECFMPRIREILKDNGFIIRTGLLWPIACVKIGASLISSTFNDHVATRLLSD